MVHISTPLPCHYTRCYKIRYSFLLFWLQISPLLHFFSFRHLTPPQLQKTTKHQLRQLPIRSDSTPASLCSKMLILPFSGLNATHSVCTYTRAIKHRFHLWLNYFSVLLQLIYPKKRLLTAKKHRNHHLVFVHLLNMVHGASRSATRHKNPPPIAQEQRCIAARMAYFGLFFYRKSYK